MKKPAGAPALRSLPGGYPPSRWRNRRLTSVEAVRAYVASLINRVESGQVEDQKAARLGNLANILAGLIRDWDLEKRLEALEAQAKENGR